MKTVERVSKLGQNRPKGNTTWVQNHQNGDKTCGENRQKGGKRTKINLSKPGALRENRQKGEKIASKPSKGSQKLGQKSSKGSQNPAVQTVKRVQKGTRSTCRKGHKNWVKNRQKGIKKCSFVQGKKTSSTSVLIYHGRVNVQRYARGSEVFENRVALLGIPFLFSTLSAFRMEGVSGTDDQVLDASMKCFDQLWSAHLRQLKIHSIPTHAEHLALVRAVRGSAPIACCVAM